MKRSRLQSRTQMKRTGFKSRQKPLRRTPLERLAPVRSVRKAKPLVKVYQNGREVLSGAAWRMRKWTIWQMDHEHCSQCGRYVFSPINYPDRYAAEIHHVYGRGMAGAKRDDRIWIELHGERVRNLVTLCSDCHYHAKM